MTIDIEKMSVRDRLDLIEKLWDSLPEQVNPDDVPEWHMEILAKRLKPEAEARATGKPWREVLAKFGDIA